MYGVFHLSRVELRRNLPQRAELGISAAPEGEALNGAIVTVVASGGARCVDFRSMVLCQPVCIRLSYGAMRAMRASSGDTTSRVVP